MATLTSEQADALLVAIDKLITAMDKIYSALPNNISTEMIQVQTAQRLATEYEMVNRYTKAVIDQWKQGIKTWET